MKAHILVVDDNTTNRKLLASLLQFEGHRVTQAGDGAEALAIARSNPPQLVISDILMPTMDGYEFVRRLRADAATAALPVIFYTANYHEREARSLAEQCGVSRVVTKPYPAAELMRIVAEVLAGETVATPARPQREFDVEHLQLLTDKLSASAETLRAANGRLAALTEVNLQMASEQDPSLLLHSVCASARTLLGARFSVLAVADKAQPGMLAVFVSGLPAAESIGTTGVVDPRTDPGVLGLVCRDRMSRRFTSTDGQPVDAGLPVGFPAVRAALAAPVCSLTRTYGWLCLGEKIGAAAFDAEDERLLTILCAQLGRIYENGSLYREVQEKATQLVLEIQERGRTTEQLRASEERFRELAEKIQDVFFVAAPDVLQIAYVSPGFEAIWGQPAQAVLGDRGPWVATVHPDDRGRVVDELQAIVQHFPAMGRVEFRIERPDGSVRWVLTRIFPIVDGGKVVRVVGVSADITERKLAELRVMRLNRTHSVLSGINSLIVRATERSALLWDSCRLAVDQGGFRGAWCGLFDADSSELAPAAYAGDAEALARQVRIRIDEAAAREGVVADAVLSRQIRYCNDLLAEEARPPYREQLIAWGYRSLVALPLVVDGAAAGCMVLLTDTPEHFDAEELRLLAELADDISFALDHIGKAERLAYLAAFDALTGLPNRSAFELRVAQYVEVSAHTQGRFAVVVADPERFEALNSTFGRTAGDDVLRQLATRFAEAAGGHDVVAHMGADQFAAILPTDDVRVTRQLEDVWRRWLGAPFSIDGQMVELGAKAGVALYPGDGTSASTLLANATAALREGKQSGKTVSFYTRELSERFAERLALEKDLRRALENGEYELHYQAKVDLASRQLRGVEALLRWRRPGHGLVSPAAFVPLLEETGLIVEVGAWALRQACADRARWRELGLLAPRVAVNVSAVQMRREDFVGRLGEIVSQPGNADALDIEVTETLLMQDVQDSLVKLEGVQQLGVGIALDDFGTGYSSLAYLAKLPVDVLKIDRSFVAAMLGDSSVTTLVSTVISLARSLKLASIAEGVETEEQAKLLHLLGCDQMQGYLVGRPMPSEQMRLHLRPDHH